MKSLVQSLKGMTRWEKFLIAAISSLFMLAVFGQFLPLPDPNEQDLDFGLLPPFFVDGGSLTHPLGTDLLGRDVLSRLVNGTRITIVVALAAVILGAFIGSLLGVIAGFVGGRADSIITRLSEAQMALPFILLAISLIAARGRSLIVVVLVLALVGWAQYVRVIRAEALSIKERSFISALRIGGFSKFSIVSKHVVPNVSKLVVTLASLEIGSMVLAESALSFVGLGVPAPGVSWGADLAGGRDYIDTAWWLVIFPGLAISSTVLLVNSAGDALQSKYDLKRESF